MNQDTLEFSKNLVRIVLPLMSKQGVPITPQNYAVWYGYATGENSELRATLDAMIDKGEPFTDEVNDRLFMKFGTGADVGEIKKLRDDLLLVLLTILNEVTEINGQSQQYESFLSNSVGLLSTDVSVLDIKSIVDCIIAETKQIVTFGKRTQDKIESITDELKTLQKNFEQARSEALKDFLTGIANRKAFEENLGEMIAAAAATPNGLCLLIIDIDHFKKFNDEHGHLVGDEVLRFTARKIKSQVKGSDFVARVGGEEFAVLLPNTPLGGARAVAENIRAFFSTATLKTSGSAKTLGTITVSIGVAGYRAGESPKAFVQRADEALFSAKAGGRNRLAVASSAPAEVLP
jgi:diguanylate cyclase